MAERGPEPARVEAELEAELEGVQGAGGPWPLAFDLADPFLRPGARLIISAPYQSIVREHGSHSPGRRGR